MDKTKQKETTDKTAQKRKPGRPRKQKTPEELAKLNKPKLTLEQKQELKLKRQKAREAAVAEAIGAGKQKPADKERFYCTNKELQAELVKWRDSAKEVENRIPSEELGRMLLAIANKYLNHSNFRNYTKVLKEDMRSYGLYKVLRGLKNYNFKFNNPFAWVT